MHDDYFQIYLEELEAVLPFGEGEEEEILRLASLRDEQARSRLIEGKLKTALTWAREYEGKGLPAADLVQEANMALILCAQAYEGAISMPSCGRRSSAASKRPSRSRGRSTPWRRRWRPASTS